MDFYNIVGNLILVDIDKNKREFKGLSQEDVIWYTQDLINKSFNSNISIDNLAIPQKNKKLQKSNYERDFENSNNSFFEKELLQVLVNIELVLASILKNESEDINNGK